MTWTDLLADQPVPATRRRRRARSRRPGALLAIVVMAGAVGTGTWFFDTDDALPGVSSGARTSQVDPTGTAPPLAVAPPPAGTSSAVADRLAAASRARHKPKVGEQHATR